jgi:two-component sensor histidine kinase
MVRTICLFDDREEILALVRTGLMKAAGIGLALHELATNAGKHGALWTNTGRVDIGGASRAIFSP